MNISRVLLFMAGGIAFAAPACADNQVSGIPSSWQLTNYNDSSGGVTVFNAGSTCVYGQMQMSASLTSNDDRNRFWSMILTAKVAGRNVVVRYETSSGNCRITNFYIE
jgi:hypothetical protein